MALLNKKQVAEELGCSVSKVEKMMKAGEIPYIKIGSLVRFDQKQLWRFFEGTTRFPAPVSIRRPQTAVRKNTTAYERRRAGRE